MIIGHMLLYDLLKMMLYAVYQSKELTWGFLLSQNYLQFIQSNGQIESVMMVKS